MSAITYANTNKAPHWGIAVYLDNRKVGEIRGDKSGWYYKPATGRRGATLPTVEAVKRSLEEH